MKTSKLIDLIIQSTLISGGIIYGISSVYKPGMNPFYSYIAVGSWQIISYGVHYFFFAPTVFQNDRIYYGKIVLSILILGVVLLIPLLFNVSITAPLIFIYLISLLILSPFLAIYYFITCLKEYRMIIRRELIHLK